jgi:rRNA-processing protein FCF1
LANVKSLVSHLRDELTLIEQQMMELLEISTVETYSVGIYPPWHWGDTDERHERIQMLLKPKYSSWFEKYNLLFSNVPEDRKWRIESTNKYMLGLIDRHSSSVDSTIQNTKSEFQKRLKECHQLLATIDDPQNTELVVVPDTNVLIGEPDVSKYAKVLGQTKYTVVIMPTVAAELDRLKVQHRDPAFRNKVDGVIRRLKGLRQQGSVLTGVTVNKTVTVRMIAAEPNFKNTLSWLDPNNNDDRVLASVLEVQRTYPSATVILLTSDINMQNKAEMAGMPSLEP